MAGGRRRVLVGEIGSPELTLPPHHDPACFGCGDNPIGFHLPQPTEEGLDRYETTFAFDERHQGGPGLAHGGMVSALLDEACGLVATWYRFPTVTGRIFLRYRRPVPINRALRALALVEEEARERQGDAEDTLPFYVLPPKGRPGAVPGSERKKGREDVG